MRTFVISLAAFVMAFSPALAAGNKCCDVSTWNDICDIGDYDLDIEDEAICLYPDGRHRDEIRITAEHRLYVKGQEVDLDDEQRELIKEIYIMAIDLEGRAKEIALEGAGIGAAGAAMGIQAVAGIFKLASVDYDSEDLEREMEYKAEKLEARAEELEELADKLEDDVQALETRLDRLEGEFPEIGDL